MNKTIFELLNETGKAITSEIELEKVVQRVTDIATDLVKAEFGAFFYNVTDHNNENLLLYTISGVPKEAFSKFPMPRNTKIFEPTFSASGTVRYDDVTAESHYGKNAPHQGMPQGHLPVKSYLAVPVISSLTKEPIGGLFFGHSKVGMFTEESEKLIEGVAIQAAIAMGNARLFEEKKHAEKKLMEQMQQYESIFNATFDSILIYDEEGTIVQANQSASEIFGYAYKELIGLHASRLFKNPGDFEMLKEIALSGRSYSGTNTRIKKDGTLVDVEFKGSYFLYMGKPHVLSACKNVNPDKKREVDLLRNQEFSQIISYVSPIVTWITNPSCQTTFINQTWIDWVGGTMDDHLGEGWLSSILPEDREMVREKFLSSFNSRKIFTVDFRIKRRMGDTRWCASHGSPYFDLSGAFGGFAGSLTDITERKEMEERLASQVTLIHTITNNTQQALFLMDEKQCCTYMNPAAEVMTGFKLDEVKEKPLHYYVHHSHPDGTHFPIEDCPIDRALPTKNQTQGEDFFIHKQGHFYPVAFTASPIVENGVPIGTVIEARDTTEELRIQEELRHKEKKAMEMLEQKVKERTSELEKSNYELLQFTSVASHDLKEPVRKISIFSRMLKDKLEIEPDTQPARYLNNIINSSERMARLIDELLSFSRLSHNSDPIFEKVDLNALLHQIIDDLEIPMEEQQAEVRIHPLPVIDGFGLQLGQLFQNLLSNSLKFSKEDVRPLIEISSIELGLENRQCKIIYKDNGIGFKPEQAEKIFEIFHRLHSKDKYDGTGVGLAIVKKIVSLHNGEIIASGKENEGVVFEITLPLSQKAE